MAAKAAFTAEEWSRLLSSPMVAGIAITAADPSGVWGLLKEGMAGGWALLKARQDAQANPLVKAVADGFATSEGRSAAKTALQARFSGTTFTELKDTALSEGCLERVGRESAGRQRSFQNMASRGGHQGRGSRSRRWFSGLRRGHSERS